MAFELATYETSPHEPPVNDRLATGTWVGLIMTKLLAVEEDEMKRDVLSRQPQKLLGIAGKCL